MRIPKNKYELHVTDTRGRTEVYARYPTKTAAKDRGLKLRRKNPGIKFRVKPIKRKKK